MCVEGFRTRSVSCRDQDGRILPDFSCDVSTRPAAVENCSLIFPNECLLTPIYGVGSFSEVCWPFIRLSSFIFRLIYRSVVDRICFLYGHNF